MSYRLKHPAQQHRRTSPDLVDCSLSTTERGLLQPPRPKGVGREALPVDEPPARCYNINNIFSSGVCSYKLHRPICVALYYPCIICSVVYRPADHSLLKERSLELLTRCLIFFQNVQWQVGSGRRVKDLRVVSGEIKSLNAVPQCKQIQWNNVHSFHLSAK